MQYRQVTELASTSAVTWLRPLAVSLHETAQCGFHMSRRAVYEGTERHTHTHCTHTETLGWTAGIR